MNQGCFLDAALSSIFEQDVSVEVMLADGGSEDETLSVIDKWHDHLTWWRSSPDEGQASAINEAIAMGGAPYVGWLNSDDLLKPGGLAAMIAALEDTSTAPAVYGQCDLISEHGDRTGQYLTSEFSERMLAMRCFIAQPATLIRRSVWESVGGLNPDYHMALDYDLWWRIYRQAGEPIYLKETIASMRIHDAAKTAVFRSRHYREAMQVLSRHYGRVPMKWYLVWPYAVWIRTVARLLRRYWQRSD